MISNTFLSLMYGKDCQILTEEIGNEFSFSSYDAQGVEKTEIKNLNDLASECKAFVAKKGFSIMSGVDSCDDNVFIATIDDYKSFYNKKEYEAVFEACEDLLPFLD